MLERFRFEELTSDTSLSSQKKKNSQIVHANMDRLDISSFRESFFPLFPLKSLSPFAIFLAEHREGLSWAPKTFLPSPLFFLCALTYAGLPHILSEEKKNGNYDTAEQRGKFLCINIRLGEKKRGVQEREREGGKTKFFCPTFFSWEIFCFANIVILSFADCAVLHKRHYLPFDTVISCT